MLNENPSIELKDFVYDSIKAYTKEVVEDRAVPEFKDGLKPVQRKILWAMYKIGLFHNLAYKKSAKVAGDVMGKYHPHGDCYPAIVNLSQANKKYYLVDGQGNWGNYDGSPAAASRYCFSGDTRIMTSEGLLRLDSFDKGNLKEEVAFDVNSFDCTEKASYWLNSGEHNTLKLKFSNSSEVICTPNQPFYVFDENKNFCWRTAESIKNTDKICLIRKPFIPVENIPENKSLNIGEVSGKGCRTKFNLPTTSSKELCAICGAIVAEGYITTNKLEIANTDMEYLKYLEKCFIKVFPGVKVNYRYRKPFGYAKKPFCQLNIASGHICRFLNRLGLQAFGKAADKRVPDFVFTSSKKEVAEFLRILFEGDGSHPKNKNIVCYVTKSKNLVEDIRNILQSYFGIFSSTYISKGLYCLHIVGKDMVLRFGEQINFFSERKKIILFTKDSWKTCVKEDYADKEIVNRLINEIKEEPRLQFLLEHLKKKKRIKHYTEFNFFVKIFKSFIKDESVIQYAQNLENFKFVKLVSREDAGVRQVYDLNVPKGHAFSIGNGCLVHNTECKLSKFAETVLLDKDYLKVIPYVDNYDGTEKEPLYLPARLPTILLLGASGIAVGTKVNIPVFELNSVIDCLIDYIKTDNLNTDNLRLAHLYKGLDITNKEPFNEYLKTGSGQLIFMPRIEEAKRDGKTALIITGIPDNFNYSNMLEKLNDMQEVKSCTDEGAGNIKIVIQLKTNLIEDKERVLKALETKYHANTDILNRLIKDKEAINANHSEANIISILKNWVKFRIYLERKYLTNLIEEKDKEIEYQKLLLKAAESLPIIFEALKQDDTEKILMEKMQIFKEQADIILNLPVKRLSKLDKEKTTEILNEKLLKKEELICKIKNIKNTVMQDLTYLKETFKSL